MRDSSSKALVLVLSLLNLSFTAGEVPDEVYQLIQETYNDVFAVNLYFCQLEDAEAGFRRLWKDGFRSSFNVRHLPEQYVPTEIQINYYLLPQRVGVFLDISCDRGVHVLKQSLDLLNASYSWLVWSPEALDTTIFSESRLSADSEFRLLRPGVVVYDVYRFHALAEIFVTPIERRNATIGYQSINQISNRTDFHGIYFNASLMMIDIKFNMSNLIPPLLDKAYESGRDMVRRYGLSVFMHLAEMYNFSFIYLPTDAWGDPLPNGTITGMVGQVSRGEAEFGLAPAKYMVSRYSVIDFVTSLHIVKVCFTFLQPKLFGSAKALVLPLDDEVWYCLGGVSLLSIVVFKILGKFDHTGTSNDNWGGACLLVVGAVSQQGIPDNTNKTSTRIVYVCLLIVCFFVAAYYNTAILNGLLLQAPNAIQNIQQLLKSEIKLGMLDIPYLHNEMLQNDSLTVQVREKITRAKPKKVYFSASDGVAKMKRGRFALYTEDEAIYTEILHQMTDAEVCSVSEVTKYNPFHVGAIARKNSPYKELFNRAFTLMRERGVSNRQLEHWLEKKPECHWRQDALTLGLEPMALAFVVFFFGVGGALISFGFELLLHRRLENEKILRRFK